MVTKFYVVSIELLYVLLTKDDTAVYCGALINCGTYAPFHCHSQLQKNIYVG